MLCPLQLNAELQFVEELDGGSSLLQSLSKYTIMFAKQSISQLRKLFGSVLIFNADMQIEKQVTEKNKKRIGSF